MKLRSRYLLLLILLSVSVMLMPASAQDSGDGGVTPAEPGLQVNPESGIRFQHMPALEAPRTLPEISVDPATAASPASDANLPARDGSGATTTPTSGPITVLIVLESPAALESVPVGAGGLTPSTAAAVQSAAAAAASLQAQVVSRLNAFIGVRVLGSTRLTVNAVAAVIDASQLAAIEALPGVLAVIPDQIGTLDNANSVPFINAVQAWEAAGGYTGAGVRVGIIDSGIDYTHANFGGSGDVNNYTSNDTTTISDAIGFDGSKVVGGYDFVGDGWISSLPLQGAGGSPLGSAWVFAAGDNDPLDCNGHGSHVAGTSAGFGVTDVGATYTGPWDSTTPFGTMTIGPGVAPEADLYALKIGDCTTSVSFVAAVLALDFAVDPDGNGNPSDHLDVLNNSYGGAYGSPLEVLSGQMNLAAQAGVIIVMSAGNEGDTYFVNGAPGVSPWGISVAASAADTTYAGLELTAGDGSYASYPTAIPANPSTGGATGSYGPYSLRLVGGSGNSQGCNVADYAGFAGEAGLIVWSAAASGCGSGTRMTNAVNAGPGNVSGLVVVSANPADFPFINLACTYNGGASLIPCVSITAADGANIAANIGAFQVRFDSALRVVGLGAGTSIADTLAGFSSRGPSIIDGTTGEIILKPDVTAPGVAITSTDAGSGTESLTIGGTSMASPHVTGVAALMRQVHPTWTVSQIKALIMNTANHDLWTEINQTGDNYGVSRIGAGRVDIGLALGSEVIAYATAHPERVSVSFSLVEVVDSETISQSITVQNRGSASQTYNLSFQNLNITPGVSFSVSPSQVTVGAGASQTVQVTLTASEAGMANVNAPDPTTPTTQTGVFGVMPRERIIEAGGYVVFTPTTATSTLRVPVHAMARPASDMATANPLQIGQADVGVAALSLAGNDVLTGMNTPDDIISQVSAFELVGEDPQTLDPSLAGADIQYVGVTSDYMSVLELCGGNTTCAITNTTIYIGIVTYGDWSTLSCFDGCFDLGFDSNENGGYDRHYFNFETGYLGNLDFTDSILSYYTTTGTSWVWGSGGVSGATDFLNGYDPGTLETYVYNNNVIVFPISATRIGLSAANTDFDFDILASANFETGDWVPVDPPYWYSYDVANPTYEFNDSYGIAGGPFLGAPMWFDLDGLAIPVGYDVTGLSDPLPPVLLLHHHNAADAGVGRAEIVQVERTTDMDGVMTKEVDDDAPAEGQTVTFTVSVSNTGPGVVEEPIIVDTLPTGLTYVSDTCPVGSTQVSVASGLEITCDLSATGVTIPAGFSFSFTIDATVDAGTNGLTLTNEAELTGWNPNSTDTDPSNNVSYASVCVGGVDGTCNPAPHVADVQENTGISLLTYPTVGTNISQLRVMFDMPVRGGTTEDGASNAGNYRLLAAGSTSGFQTSTCTSPVDSGDTALGFSASYNSASNYTTLTISSSPLAAGSYRVIVCGSTSIVNTQGIPLDGNNDGTGGDDAVIDFTVDFGGGGVVSPDGTTGSTALTTEEMSDMSLPATGEVPWYMPTPFAIAVLVMGAVVGGAFVIRRRKTSE